MQIAQLIPEHNASLETMQPAYPMRVEEKDRRPYRLLRQQWMQHYQNQVGGPGALAAALDSTDTHITAMVKGRRNVGDDLADKLEETFNLLPGTIDLCDPAGLAAHPSGLVAFPVNQPARSQPNAVHTVMPSLAQALEVVATKLNLLTDDQREMVAQRLQTLARAPDSQRAREAVLATLEPSAQESDAQQQATIAPELQEQARKRHQEALLQANNSPDDGKKRHSA